MERQTPEDGWIEDPWRGLDRESRGAGSWTQWGWIVDPGGLDRSEKKRRRREKQKTRVRRHGEGEGEMSYVPDEDGLHSDGEGG